MYGSPLGYPLGKPKVCNAYVARCLQDDVLWFEVSVHNVLGVQVLQGRHYLSRVEGGRRVVEALCSPQVGEELSPRHVVQEHVEEAVVMVRPLPAGRGGWSEEWGGVRRGWGGIERGVGGVRSGVE